MAVPITARAAMAARLSRRGWSRDQDERDGQHDQAAADEHAGRRDLHRQGSEAAAPQPGESIHRPLQPSVLLLEVLQLARQNYSAFRALGRSCYQGRSLAADGEVAVKRSLAKRLKENRILVAPGVFDMVSLKLADAMGFEALYATG
jgi:hypothetical protein